MPAEISSLTIGQTLLGGTGGGATEVVGADDERYDGDPGRGGSEEGGGTKEGGSEAICITGDGTREARRPEWPW